MSKIVDTGKEVVKHTGNGITGVLMLALIPLGFFVLSLLGPVPDAILGGVGLPEVNGTSVKIEAQIREKYKKKSTKSTKTNQTTKKTFNLLDGYVVTGFTHETVSSTDGKFSVIQLQVQKKNSFNRKTKKEFMEISSDFLKKENVLGWVLYDSSNKNLVDVMAHLAVEMNNGEISYFYIVK